MAEFVFRDLFEFNSKFYKQISGTAISAKFDPPRAFIFMDYIETEFLKFQHKTLALEKIHRWFFLLFGQIQRKILISFWKILTNFTPTLNLPMKSQEKIIISWM